MPEIFVTLLFCVEGGRLMKKNEPRTLCQQSQMPPNEYDTLLDNKMNRLLKVENSNYGGFLFTTKAIKLDSALVAESVCPSRLCDGQTYHDPCPRLETKNKPGQNLGYLLCLHVPRAHHGNKQCR